MHTYPRSRHVTCPVYLIRLQLGQRTLRNLILRTCVYMLKEEPHTAWCYSTLATTTPPSSGLSRTKPDNPVSTATTFSNPGSARHGMGTPTVGNLVNTSISVLENTCKHGGGRRGRAQSSQDEPETKPDSQIGQHRRGGDVPGAACGFSTLCLGTLRRLIKDGRSSSGTIRVGGGWMHGAGRIARARVPELHPSAVDQKRVANSWKPHVNLLASHVARCRSESP